MKLSYMKCSFINSIQSMIWFWPKSLSKYLNILCKRVFKKFFRRPCLSISIFASIVMRIQNSNNRNRFNRPNFIVAQGTTSSWSCQIGLAVCPLFFFSFLFLWIIIINRWIGDEASKRQMLIILVEWSRDY